MLKWKRCNEKNSYVRKTNTLKKSKTLSVSPLEPLKHLTVWIYLYGPTSASRIFVRREKENDTGQYSLWIFRKIFFKKRIERVFAFCYVLNTVELCPYIVSSSSYKGLVTWTLNYLILW